MAKYQGPRATKRPPLPPPSDPRFLDAIKEFVEQSQGLRGDDQDRFVSFRDLDGEQLAKAIVGKGSAGLDISKAPSVGGNTGGTERPVLTKPEQVKGFTVDGAFSVIILSWDYPKYANHAFTEIARAATNDISQAETIGFQPSNMHNDEVGNEFEGYYWIRHISTSGVKGAWSQGMQAETPSFEDAIPEAVISVAKIKDGFFDNLTAAKGKITQANISIANIFNALVENYIKSANYVKNTAGWILNKAGDAEFNNVKMRGLIHNGDLDGNGNPAGNSRYLDFREGSSTNGDFVFGDVEAGNGISYKYEPSVGKRLLRVRGDILLRDYAPGPYLLHMNASEKQSFTATGRADTLMLGECNDQGLKNKINSDLNTIRPERLSVIKRTAITRNGVVTVSFDFSTKNLGEIVDPGYTAGLEVFANNIGFHSIPVICIKKPNGAVTLVDRFDEVALNGDPVQWGPYKNFTKNIAVEYGDILEIRSVMVMRIRLILGYVYVAPLKLKILSKGMKYLPDFSVQCRVKDLRLGVDFYPSETSLL